MKRVLLMGLVLGIGVSGFSQSRLTQATNRMQQSPRAQQDAVVLGTPVKPVRPVLPKAAFEVDKVTISSSLNIYSVLVEEQTCVAYNPDLNLITMTHRGHTNVIGTGNDLIASTSTDGGNSFSSKVSIPATGGKNHRYPSGVIYNPTGNTDPQNAFHVMAGPYTTSAWEGNYFASTTFGGANSDEQTVTTPAGGDLLSRNGMTIDGNGIVHHTGLQYTGTSGPLTYDGYVYKGTFNSTTNKFEWTSQTLHPETVAGSDGGHYLSYTQMNTAWSPDGSVGYVFFVGSDARAGADRSSYQPIVYKSTDGGATWELMDYINLVNHPEMEPYLFPLRREYYVGGTVKPLFTETDGVVDANGNLHIFTLAEGAYSDHIDSIGYVYEYEKGAIFELYNENQGNSWTVHYIDTLETRDVPKEESGYGTGDDALAWGHRIQASRSADGKVVFATWTDTDTEFFGTEFNLYPDVLGFARHLDYGVAEVKNFTRGSNVYGEAFYNYASEVVMNPDANTWQIPYTITDIRTSNDPGLPVFYSFLTDIKFNLSDFPVGIGAVSGVVNKVEAFPNPTTGHVKFTIDLAAASSVAIEITNLMGQKVLDVVNQPVAAGSHTFTAELNNLKAGVYFYSVVAGENRVTRKLVVK